MRLFHWWIIIGFCVFIVEMWKYRYWKYWERGEYTLFGLFCVFVHDVAFSPIIILGWIIERLLGKPRYETRRR